MNEEVWNYGPTAGYPIDADIVGYRVEALDGHIGKVDKHSREVGAAYLVVDTGPWILGKEVLIPAGVVERIDPVQEKVYVSRSKEQIKNAPEFDRDKHEGDSGYHEEVGGYYGGPPFLA
ncbi:hypothetical protein GCM10027589_53150 [Actinocorallia lasiicapitis]